MSPVLLALALSATTISTSKLGVFVVGDIGSTTSPAPIIAACPALAVFPFDPADPNAGTTLSQQVTVYRSVCPRGQVVLRMSATGFDTTSLLSQVNQLLPQIQSVALRGDAVEIPLIGDPNQVAGYWAQVAQLLSPFYLPLIGAGTISTPTAFCATVNAVRNTGFNGFGVGFQVSSPMTFSASDPAFMFAQVSVACGLSVPMFITQMSPLSNVWDSSTTTWLAWFDQQIARMNLGGAALFQLGGAPDIAAIEPWLVNYFPNPLVPDGGFPDGGDGGGSGGTVPAHVTAGGTLSPPKEGCSTAGPGFFALLVIPALFLLRTRTRGDHGVKR